MRIESEHWGLTRAGGEVRLFRLSNARGTELELLNYGARMHALRVADREGRRADLLQGFSSVADYAAAGPYYGACCGPYANRIEGARGRRRGRVFGLPANEGANCLHGGPRGFHALLWESRAEGDALCFSADFRARAQDFPGAFLLELRYRLSERDEVDIEYRIEAKEDALFNLTNHSYFNLAGEGARDLAGHRLRVAADFYTPSDAQNLCTGEIRAVAGTAWDLRAAEDVPERLARCADALAYSLGYDQNWVLRKEEPGDFALAAELSHAPSGRRLRVYTTAPGLQVYSANHPPGAPGKSGFVYPPHSALCLETQGLPNSLKHTHFPQVWVPAGEARSSRTRYAFDLSD